MVGRVEVTEEFALVGCDMRQPECLSAMENCCTRQPDKQRESHYDSNSPLQWLVPLGLTCICHVPYGALQPERSFGPLASQKALEQVALAS